jgi:hypothetical protein
VAARLPHAGQDARGSELAHRAKLVGGDQQRGQARRRQRHPIERLSLDIQQVMAKETLGTEPGDCSGADALAVVCELIDRGEQVQRILRKAVARLVRITAQREHDLGLLQRGQSVADVRPARDRPALRLDVVQVHPRGQLASHDLELDRPRRLARPNCRGGTEQLRPPGHVVSTP